MRVLYNLAVIFGGWLLHIPALFIPKISAFVKGRKRLFSSLKKWRENHEGTVLWVHCASLGEFEMSRPILDHPDFKYSASSDGKPVHVLVTFFSPSGYDVVTRNDKYNAFYIPIDTTANAKRFISIVKPAEAIFIKNEFWFNFLHELNRKDIPTYLINGMIRSDQLFFRAFGSWFRKHLHYFRHIMVQDEGSAELLRSMNIRNDRISVTGDMRYDRVASIREEGRALPEIEKFKTAERLVIGGSTWTEEEDILAVFLGQHSEYDCIIAPHDVSEQRIKSIENTMMAFGVQKYSEWDKEKNDFRVLIIDSVGLLSRIYRYGDIAFVGGGFGNGLHNILEPAGFGLPVIFGPKTSEFPEAKRFVQLGIGYQVKDFDTFARAVRSAEISNQGSDVLNKMKPMEGATERTLDILRPGRTSA